MKRIKFDNPTTSWIFVLIPVLTMLVAIFGFFRIIPFNNPDTNRIITYVGFSLFIISSRRSYFFKNHVEWRKNIIIIRIKSFLGVTLRFNKISHTELNNEILAITKHDGKVVSINLIDIDPTDTQKLKDILDEKSQVHGVVG